MEKIDRTLVKREGFNKTNKWPLKTCFCFSNEIKYSKLKWQNVIFWSSIWEKTFIQVFKQLDYGAGCSMHPPEHSFFPWGRILNGQMETQRPVICPRLRVANVDLEVTGGSIIGHASRLVSGQLMTCFSTHLPLLLGSMRFYFSKKINSLTESPWAIQLDGSLKLEKLRRAKLTINQELEVSRSKWRFLPGSWNLTSKSWQSSNK